MRRCSGGNFHERIAARGPSALVRGLLMPKLPLAATAVASVFVTLATGSVAKTVPDFPLAVICFSEQTQTWRIGYLQEVSKDGSAVYVAAAGHLRVTVNANGLVQPPSDRPPGVDCFGKTLKELRAEGRVVEFGHTQ